MADRPKSLILTAAEVRAALGRDTWLRFVPVKPSPPDWIDDLHGNNLRGRAPYWVEDDETGRRIAFGFCDDYDRVYRSPFKPGDVVVGREQHWRRGYNHRVDYGESGEWEVRWEDYNEVRFDPPPPPKAVGWQHREWDKRSAAQMPVSLARFRWTVSAVAVLRIQDVTYRDVYESDIRGRNVCSGCGGRFVGDPSCDCDSEFGCDAWDSAFKSFWTARNGPEAWDANAWCWRIELQTVKGA